MSENALIISHEKYAQLVSDVRALITQGKIRSQEAVLKELTVTYWGVGKRILNEHLPINTGYFGAILSDLADELAIDVSTLHRSVDFAQTHPEITDIPDLSWSKCKLLLPIADDEKRQYYENLAITNSLTCKALSSAIKNGSYEETTTAKTSTQTTSKKIIKRPTKATYVYKAIVENVVDGDTLLVRIDLGFATWRQQRIRLASIDTPAMDQPKGQEAADFVSQCLDPCDFIMIKTNKIDIYGRYIGHIFYLPDETNKAKIFETGHYLNQQLLDHDLAIVF